MAELIDAHNSSWPGQRLVHAGSAAEYGCVDGPVTESSLGAPVGMYGGSKLAGTFALEQVRRNTGLRAATVRLFTIYGPGERPVRLLPSLIAAAQSRTVLPLTPGQQRRDFTYVGDVAEGLLRIGLLRSAPPVINLATGRLTAVREFVECAAELLDLRPKQLQFGALPEREDEVRQGPVDARLLRRLTGWVPPTSIRQGIAQTIACTTRTGAVRSSR
jgi:nucleoside-diphosphate-sugar epimerase